MLFHGRGRNGKRHLLALAPCGSIAPAGENPLSHRFAMPACLLLALRATSPGRGSLSKGEPRPWRERFLPLFRKGTKGILGVLLASPFGRGGCDQREQTERAHPLPCGELPPQRLRGLQIGEARKKCNGDDRRQRRIQGGAVGAAVSRTRVPLKARSGRWAPQPV